MFDILQRSEIPAIVYNCGISSYDSPREFIKLCRDGLTLHPDIVICYSGWNDFMLHPDLPTFTNRYHRPWMDEYTEVGFRRDKNHLGGKTSYGLQTQNTLAESWVQHMRMMHGVCEELGITFAAFFQGTLGTKSNVSVSDYEKKIFRTTQKKFLYQASASLRARGIKYFDLKPAYDYAEEVSRLIEDIPYVYNFRNIFSGFEELFFDNGHVVDAGNHLIAQKIFLTLQAEHCMSEQEVRR